MRQCRRRRCFLGDLLPHWRTRRDCSVVAVEKSEAAGAPEAEGRRHAVFVPYPANNSSVRTRALTWIDRLVDAGVLSSESVTVYGPGFERRASAVGSDVLLLRNARRFSRGRTEQRILQRAGFGVYDIDDGLPWDSGDLPGLGHWSKRPWPRSLIARRAASAADRVVAGNSTLADWAEQHCDDVVVVPTCVEPDDYIRRDNWTQPAQPVIGWIGSPPTTPYLAAIAPALREACRRTGARIEVVGADAEKLQTLADLTTFVPWDNLDAMRRISTWDLGVMPLRDGVYERAKAGYKLLQYAAAGVPAVGSPVGVNETLLAAMDGEAPASIDDWADAIVSVLTESSNRRQDRATAGLACAHAYSYEVWQDRWVDAVGWLR